MNRLVWFTLATLLAVGTASANCKSISHKVCSLTGYNPVPTGPYVPPRCTGGTDPTLVDAAFSIAPPGIQQELCRPDLLQIFIVADGDDSWGKWEDPQYPGQNNVSYIGLSSRALGRLLPTQEDKNLADLGVRRGAGKHEHAAPQRDSRELNVLATLAHELGHIKFRRDRIRESQCFRDAFLKASWSSGGDYERVRWLPFGADIGTPLDVAKPPGSSAANLLAIYTKGFATALAAMSPEEDFVETYKVAALIATAKPRDLRIVLGTRKLKLNQRGRSPILDGKLACVAPMIGAL